MNRLMITFGAILASLLVLAPSTITARPLETGPDRVVADSGIVEPTEKDSRAYYYLAYYGFDSGPEGWESIDWNLNPQAGTYFTFQQSIYPGGDMTAVCAADLPGWVTGPGYGTNWNQALVSDVIPNNFTDFDLQLEFSYSHDLELDFDFAYVEFQDQFGDWVQLVEFTGYGAGTWMVSVPPHMRHSAMRFRFRVVTDGSHDDADGNHDSAGALEVDDLRIIDLAYEYFEDFEDEVSGGQVTNDGMWFAEAVLGTVGFGSYGALHDAATIAQDDSCSSLMTTQAWAFFDDPASTNYACGGHPEQGAIPFEDGLPDSPVMREYLVSPWIQLDEDENGAPIPPEATDLRLLFSLYADLPHDFGIFYHFKVQFRVGDVDTEWIDGLHYYYVEEPTHAYRRIPLSSYLVAGASHVRVALGVENLPIYDLSDCHSQGPIFDDIQLAWRTRIGAWWTDTAPTADALLDGTLATNRFDAVDGSDMHAVDINHHGMDLAEDAPGETAVYAHVWTNRSLTGGELAPDDPQGGVYVDSDLYAGGKSWHTYRLARDVYGSWTFDLNDSDDGVPFWQPGDLVEYFYSCRDEFGITRYYSDKHPTGGGTEDLEDAAATAMEFRAVDLVAPQEPPPVRPYLLLNLAADPLAATAWDEAAAAAGEQASLLRIDGVAPAYDFFLAAFDAVFIAGDPGTALLDECVDALRLAEAAGESWSLYVEGRDTPAVIASWINPFKENFFAVDAVASDQTNMGFPPDPQLAPATGCEDWGDCGTSWGLAEIDCRDTYRYDLFLASPSSTVTASRLLEFDHAPLPEMHGLIGFASVLNDGLRTMVASFRLQDLEGDRGVFLANCLNYLEPGTEVGIADEGPQPALRTALHAAYPNPFNPRATIAFDTATPGPVRLQIFDLRGRLVRTLVDERMVAGRHQAIWNGLDEGGRPVSAGAYLYRFEADGFSRTRRMLLVK